jgi:pimeloyl-ACP methyl ester carboxylesterase
VWDVPAAPASVGTAMQSDVPVLLLAGGLDPFTPPTWASMAAEGLSSSQLVDVPTAGHDVMIWEPDCATLLMHAFLGSPGDQLDRSCLDALTIAAFTTG